MKQIIKKKRERIWKRIMTVNDLGIEYDSKIWKQKMNGINVPNIVIQQAFALDRELIKLMETYLKTK